VWSNLLLIHLEFSQFFVAHSSDEVRDRRVGARSIAGTLKNTMAVYKLRCAETQHLQNSSNTSSKLGSPSTCKPWSRSLQPCRMPQSVRNGQFPKPCHIFPPHMSPAEATMLPVAPESQTSPPWQCTVHRYRLLLTVHPPRPDVLIVVR